MCSARHCPPLRSPPQPRVSLCVGAVPGTPSDLLVLKLAGGLQQLEERGEGLGEVLWQMRCSDAHHAWLVLILRPRSEHLGEISASQGQMRGADTVPLTSVARMC